MQSTEGVKFKCLYRLPSGKTIARQHGKVLGTYSSERRAAQALAAHTGVQIKDLKRRGARQTTQHGSEVMVRGVYRTQDGKFEVRLDGQYRGRFESAAIASQELAKIAGAPPCLSKKDSRVELAAKRFASAKETFKTWRPADMKDLIDVRKKHPLFCVAPGPLYMLAVVGKERSWRASVIRLAQGLSASTRANLCALSGRIGLDAGAQRVRIDVAKDVHGLLVAACQAMIGRTDEEKAYWVRHVNRNVAHHAGWLPFMQRMGILAKTTKQDKNKLEFGDPDTVYKTMPFSEEKLVGHLVSLSAMQQVLLAISPPRNLDEWIEGCKFFKTAVPQRNKQDSYTFIWTFRAAMIAERAVAGYAELGYSSKNSTDDFAEAFPDQKQWVPYFCPCGPMQIGTFVKQLGYTDSIEYLTCDLCILMPVADRLSTIAGDLDPQVKKCRSAEDDALCSSGEQAHPAVVARQVAIIRTSKRLKSK